MSKLKAMLQASAEADKTKALLTLELLENNAVGIGDHSTEDFYKNAEEALSKLCDANDRLETIEKYFGGTDTNIDFVTTTT
jgi:hypothetical protein